MASAEALAQACARKQVADVQRVGSGGCELDAPPDRVVCVGTGLDSWRRFAWKDGFDAWGTASTRRRPPVDALDAGE